MHIYALAIGLLNRGHDVHIVSGGPSDNNSAIKIFADTVEYGVKHHQVGFPLQSNQRLSGKVKQLYQYITATPKALYILFTLQPDVIHVHYPVTSYIARIFCVITGKKFITTHHTSGIPKHPLHKKADYAIAISSDLKNELHEKFHYNNKQISLIFNGVSKEKFCRTINSNERLNRKQKLNLPTDKVIIGYLGSFIHRKGIDILLDASRFLDKEYFHLVLVGDGDSDRVASIVEKLSLVDNVTLFPYQDPVKFYEVFDIFTLPSRKEGFPLVSIEAMMMGIPTIRSDVEGAKDQIDHGIDGYLFKSEDSLELYKHMHLLIYNDKLRMKIGKKAKVKALNFFSEEIMIEKLLELYEKTLRL